jgi:hypothetical protein
MAHAALKRLALLSWSERLMRLRQGSDRAIFDDERDSQFRQ